MAAPVAAPAEGQGPVAQPETVGPAVKPHPERIARKSSMILFKSQTIQCHLIIYLPCLLEAVRPDRYFN